MANYVWSSVIFYVCGNEEEKESGLQDLYGLLKKLSENGEFSFSEVLDEKESPKVLKSGDFISIGEMEENRFMASTQCRWEAPYPFFKALCKKYGISFCSASEWDNGDGFEIKGDMDARFFPYNFSVDIWGSEEKTETGIFVPEHDIEFFDTEREMTDWLNDGQHYGMLFRADTWQEWDCFLDSYSAGHIRVWNRVE